MHISICRHTNYGVLGHMKTGKKGSLRILMYCIVKNGKTLGPFRQVVVSLHMIFACYHFGWKFMVALYKKPCVSIYLRTFKDHHHIM